MEVVSGKKYVFNIGIFSIRGKDESDKCFIEFEESN